MRNSGGRLWDHIQKSVDPTSVNMRRASTEHPIDWFKGRDHLGRYALILQSEVTTLLDFQVPKMNGIQIEILPSSKTHVQLIVLLLDMDKADIFSMLCDNLIEVTRAKLSRHPVSVVLDELRGWQDLLAKRLDSLLTNSERIGLMGELLFLEEILLPVLGGAKAMLSWRGPFGDEQDFQLAKGLIEVKTQLASHDRALRISSAAQLDAVSGDIVLAHQTLMQSTRSGADLNSMVRRMRSLLERESQEAVATFDLGLVRIGYRVREEYGVEAMELSKRRFFRVEGDFPRITAPDLRPGVVSVSYSIDLEACKPYEISKNEFEDQYLETTASA